MKTKINKFGFEIEAEFSTDIRNKLRNYGEIRGDGSINRCRGNSKTCPDYNEGGNSLECAEFVSRPYLLTEKKEVKKLFALLIEARKAKKHHWNASMGFHIHVSFKPQMPVEIFSTQFADYFFKAMAEDLDMKGVITRRGNNKYCKIGEYNDRDIYAGIDRYRAINFKPAYDKHGTVEFRIWPSASPWRMYKFLVFTLKTIKLFLQENLEVSYASEFGGEKSTRKYIFEAKSFELKPVNINV